MLSGNLDLFALADVLRFVARSGATGAVNIYRPSEGGRILLADGEVVGATVESFEATDHDGVVEAGLRLLDGGSGEFALDIEDVEGPTREGVEEFLSAIKRRRGEWKKIVAAVGSVDAPMHVDAHVPDGVTEITLSPLEWQLAVSSDGHRSLREVASDLGTSPFAAAQALLAMSNAGLLSLPGTGVVEAADDEEEDDEPASEPARRAPVVEAAPEYDEEDVTDEPEAAQDEDLDPAELLRELGGQRPPRARRLTPATREEQRLRLRSR
ncbi:MAG: DUF4388 domain-containing protein [Actinomycetota bacterium]